MIGGQAGAHVHDMWANRHTRSSIPYKQFKNPTSGEFDLQEEPDQEPGNQGTHVRRLYAQLFNNPQVGSVAYKRNYMLIILGRGS